jgi:hypothetical protein
MPWEKVTRKGFHGLLGALPGVNVMVSEKYEREKYTKINGISIWVHRYILLLENYKLYQKLFKIAKMLAKNRSKKSSKIMMNCCKRNLT